jgi:iron complex transport system substrate-binding protein
VCRGWERLLSEIIGYSVSREGAKRRDSFVNVEEVSAVVVDAGFQLHRGLGPGLLESVYEVVLARMLGRRGLRVERQQSIPFEFDGMHFDAGFRVDLLVEDCLVVELKSVEALAPVHSKQLLTYLRLLELPVGLLINFGAPTFRQGVKRVVNKHHDFASSRLRVNLQAGLARSREEHEGDRAG